jgi:predicted DNA-binding protein with PD1-like motif
VVQLIGGADFATLSISRNGNPAMKWQIINEGKQRTFALIFDSGDEVVDGLKRFAHATTATAAEFIALGALSDIVLGYFDWQRKDYRRIAIDEQVEVVSLVGNFALGEDGSPTVHPHIVVAKSARGLTARSVTARGVTARGVTA